MVATDVASRGIGMLDRIFIVPFPLLVPSIFHYMWLRVDSSSLCNGIFLSA